MNEIVWDHATMPFKHVDASPLDAYHVGDPDVITKASDRIKKILDAKYEPADLKKVCSAHSHLQMEQQQKLLSLLEKYGDLFDGTLGTWTGSEINLQLSE